MRKKNVCGEWATPLPGQSVTRSRFSFKVPVGEEVLGGGGTQTVRCVLEGEKRSMHTESDVVPESTITARGAWRTGSGTSAPIPPYPWASWAFPWSYQTT